MAIDFTKKIIKLRVNGVEIPLATTDPLVVTSTTSTGYVILCGDIGGTTLTCYDSQNNQIDTYTTPAVTGGPKTFSVPATGLYSVVATRNGAEVWRSYVNVTGIGVFQAKAPLQLYSAEEIHTICQGGYFSAMFAIRDKWTYTQTGSIVNNFVHFVKKIKLVNGKNRVSFGMEKKTSATYQINPKFAYLSSASATSFSNTYSNNGGYKYCDLRLKMLEAGADDIYTQASGIKPTGSSIATGIEFDKIYYTDGGGRTSGVYSYNKETDSFTQDNDYTFFSSSSTAQTDVKFVKGYFTSVGQLTQEEFNAGYHYTRTTVSDAPVYTLATSYSSSTTYYGFFETMQQDGAFVAAYNDIKQYLARRVDYASAGGTQTTYTALTQDLVGIDCVEEITGLNRTMTLPSGSSATTANAYNLANEGEKFEAYDFFLQTLGSEYWTRSTYSYNAYNFCYITGNGIISYYNVYYSYGVRLGFEIE